MRSKVVVHWFRRDLRLRDNTALNEAARSGLPILPLFIFDADILAGLSQDDRRVSLIYDSLRELDIRLKARGSGLQIRYGKPVEVFAKLAEEYEITGVYTNRDYEPYAIRRDQSVDSLLRSKGAALHSFKDQVIFEHLEIKTAAGSPYTVYTPYKRRWIEGYMSLPPKTDRGEPVAPFLPANKVDLPALESFGFRYHEVNPPRPQTDAGTLADYKTLRDFPAANSTANISVHLRFGLLSVRDAVRAAVESSQAFLSELIWREFFMQILANFPHVEQACFRPGYERIAWRNNEAEFERWCRGETGYALVDAGMRQLNETGLMHNRVRMVVASFLCKHLLVDWRWGEAYFASKLLDYEMASNNGNWQWAAGCGCDAAPYFRIFNPDSQARRFDPDLKYIRTWIPDYDSRFPAPPIVDHKFARERALRTYRHAISG